MNIKTTLLIYQHNRCKNLLDMIMECERRISSYKQSIAFHESATHSESTIDFYYSRWKITLDIKERLVNSYSNALAKIVKPVIDKMEIIEQ